MSCLRCCSYRLSPGKEDGPLGQRRGASALLSGQRLLQCRNYLKDGPTPKRGCWIVLPSRLRGEHDCHIPIKALARIGPGGRCDLHGHLLQTGGNPVIRIPELARTRVRNSGQRAPARRAPIGGQNRLPYNKHAHFPFRMLGQKPLGCGGPPQTIGSSRRQQQN